MVVAKKPEAKAHLSMQFFHKTTKREYRALVWGIVRDDEGRVEGNIGRNPRDRMQMTVFPEGDQGRRRSHTIPFWNVWATSRW